MCRSFQVDIFNLFVDIVEVGLFQPAETSPTTSCVELQLMAGGRCAMACAAAARCQWGLSALLGRSGC